MKRKWTVLLLGMLLLLAGCGSPAVPPPEKPEDQTPGTVVPPEGEDPSEEEPFRYYPSLSPGETLYYIKASDMTSSEYLLAVSLQGILAQKGKSSIYIDARDTDPTQSYAVWREDLEENYGLTFEYQPSVYELLRIFREDVSEQGYIFCDRESLNGATVAAGVYGYLLAREDTRQALDELGFVKKLDYAEECRNSAQSFDKVIFERFKDKVTTSLLIHQSPDKLQLRDYAIAVKAYCFYVYDPRTNQEENAFVREVYEFMDKDIPILGWAEDELSFVDLNSEYGKITIASDWSDNLSFLGAIEATDIVQNRYEGGQIVPEKGKHYAAIVMSDGDNVQWYQGGFINSPKYYANEYKGTFPITYGISPSLSDLAPTLMQKIYSCAAPSDYFTAAVSGQGYINVTQYSELKTFAQRTDIYMRRSGLDYMTFLDEGTLETMDASFWQEFAQYDGIKGAMWMYGDKYAGGKGAIRWSEGKPLVAFRDAIWEEDPRRVATRVNSYKKDYTCIEGYSFIVAHCWSTPFDLIKRFADSLSDDVVLVTAEQLFDMIVRYVPQEDKVYLDDKDPADASLFNYDSSAASAYVNQSRRLAVSENILHSFDEKGTEGYGINLADGMSVGIVADAGVEGGALRFSCTNDTAAGENAYVMFRDKLPASGEKYIEFYVRGNSSYAVKMISIVGTVTVLQAETPAAQEYRKVRIPLKNAVGSATYIIEQNGTGELYLDSVRIVGE